MGYKSYISTLSEWFPPIFHLSPSTSKERNSKIAWLEGLRGFATLLVYLEHSVGFAHDQVWAIHRAFGWRDAYYAVCFPGLRLFVLSNLAAL